MGTRFAVAVAVATLTMAAGAMSVSAATYNFGVGATPASPFHMAVGDFITLAVPPPPVQTPPPRATVTQEPAVDLSTTAQDAAVLARVSEGHDSSGNVVATFEALRAGTASILRDESSLCYIVGGSATTSSTSRTAVTPATSGSATTSATSSSSTASSVTSGSSGVCAATASQFLAVIVDVRVQGASTSVPAAGASVPWSGVGLLLAGMAVVVAVVGRRDTRHRD